MTLWTYGKSGGATLRERLEKCLLFQATNKEEFVTAGGVDLKSVRAGRMESAKVFVFSPTYPFLPYVAPHCFPYISPLILVSRTLLRGRAARCGRRHRRVQLPARMDERVRPIRA